MDFDSICHICKSNPAELACECGQDIILLDMACALPHFQDQSRTHKLLDLASALNLISALKDAKAVEEPLKSEESLLTYKNQLSSFISQFMSSRTKILDKLEEITEKTMNQLSSIIQEINYHIKAIADNKNSNTSESDSILQKYTESELGDILSYYPEYLDILEQDVVDSISKLVYIGTKPFLVHDHAQSYKDRIQKLEKKKKKLKDIIDNAEKKEQKHAEKYNQINKERFLLNTDVKRKEDQILNLSHDLIQIKQRLSDTQLIISEKDVQLQGMIEFMDKLKLENTELLGITEALNQDMKPIQPPQLKPQELVVANLMEPAPKLEYSNKDFILPTQSCIFCSQIMKPEDRMRDKICECNMCANCYMLRIKRDILRCEICTLPLTRSQLAKCELCTRDVIFDQLPKLKCQHRICVFCLIFHIESQMQQVNLVINCPNCPSEIDSDIYSKFISEEIITTYSESIFKRLDQERSDLACMKCSNKVSEDNQVKLECGHSFCKKCLKRNWNYHIKYKTFGCIGLSCIKCFYTVPSIIAKSVLSPNTFEKFMYIIITRRNKSFSCKECGAGFTWLGFNVECPNMKCRAKLCMKCSELQRSCLCKAYRKTPNFDSWITKYGKCPSCGMMNYKTKGKSDKITCINLECGVSYCIRCLRRHEPIFAHGNSYHHKKCYNYTAPKTESKYKPDKCVMCKITGGLCSPGQEL
jgi:hypothetical protein